MAKQIYIDANGNEIEISGTINNAEILPISASDPTPTADKLKRTAETITVESGFTKRSAHLYKINNVVYFDFNISINTGNITGRTVIGTISEGYRPLNGTVVFVVGGSTQVNGLCTRQTTCLIALDGKIYVGDSILPSSDIKEVSAAGAYICG